MCSTHSLPSASGSMPMAGMRRANLKQFHEGEGEGEGEGQGQGQGGDGGERCAPPHARQPKVAAAALGQKVGRVRLELRAGGGRGCM